MNSVEAIRDKKKIEAVKRYFLGGRNYRDNMLFVMGINTGLRISDLLRLKVSDVLDEKGHFREFVYLREKKTGKEKHFPLNESAREAIDTFLEHNGPPDPDRFLFASRKGDNKPMTRIRAYQIVNEACRAVGLNIRAGTHTLRKTFGFHAFKAGVPAEFLQKVFNHSTASTTLRYIGIEQEDINTFYQALNL
jgi:integrase